tara:strand:+ start:3736 stop:4215 length:480 start_codon:yes stop_codon:yes gene_type:complete
LTQKSWITATRDELIHWAQAHSMWYFPVQSGCCANELIHTYSSQYDIERFGVLPQVEPRQADLLIITGAINSKSVESLKRVYFEMVEPKYVIALGACACSGGLYRPTGPITGIGPVDEWVPVDVYIPGCPPRPETILHGLKTLQEKIRERVRVKKKNFN